MYVTSEYKYKNSNENGGGVGCTDAIDRGKERCIAIGDDDGNCYSLDRKCTESYNLIKQEPMIPWHLDSKYNILTVELCFEPAQLLHANLKAIISLQRASSSLLSINLKYIES